MRLAAMLVVLGACVHRPPYKHNVDDVVSIRRPPVPVKHATSSDAEAWHVGQWALYRRREGNLLAYDRLSVVAEDSCGIWLEVISEDYEQRHKWLFCIARTLEPPKDSRSAFALLRVAIEQVDDRAPVVTDTLYGTRTLDRAAVTHALALLVPRSWPMVIADTEEIVVPAGRFFDALKYRWQWVDHAPQHLTAWTRPGLPFGGTVHAVSDDGSYSYELVAYGECGAPTIVPDLAEELASARRKLERQTVFLAFAMGWGHLSGHASEEGTGTGAFSLLAGTKITERLAAFFALQALTGASYSPDPSLWQDSTLFGGGVRWYLDGDKRARPYVQAIAGYADLERYSASTTAHVAGSGVGAAASIGLIALDSVDWKYFGELGEQIAFYNSNEGIRRGWFFQAGIQLYLPWPLFR